MQSISRRQFVQLALGTIATTTLYSRIGFAAETQQQTDGRFILLFLRGGFDGLFALAPSSDPQWQTLRPTLSQPVLEQGIRAGNTGFTFHPACADLATLFQNHELSFHPSAGTTDTSRSHFQAQDLFEIGNGASSGDRGFLARMATVLDNKYGNTRGAISFTREIPLIFRGGEQSPQIAPLSGSGLKLPDNATLKAIRAMHADSATGSAIDLALSTQAEIDAAVDMEGAARNAIAANGFPAIAAHMGRVLRANPKLSLAFIDLGGVDTHANEAGILERMLTGISQGIAALKNALGDTEWKRTRLVITSEFGRTAQENGTRGTDHGHGNAFFIAGGNINGGKMLGDFAGLNSNALHEQRDLPVLADWRALISAVVTQTYGLTAGELDFVFPGRPKQTLSI